MAEEHIEIHIGSRPVSVHNAQPDWLPALLPNPDLFATFDEWLATIRADILQLSVDSNMVMTWGTWGLLRSGDDGFPCLEAGG